MRSANLISVFGPLVKLVALKGDTENPAEKLEPMQIDGETVGLLKRLKRALGLENDVTPEAIVRAALERIGETGQEDQRAGQVAARAARRMGANGVALNTHEQHVTAEKKIGELREVLRRMGVDLPENASFVTILNEVLKQLRGDKGQPVTASTRDAVIRGARDRYRSTPGIRRATTETAYVNLALRDRRFSPLDQEDLVEFDIGTSQ